MGVFPPVPSLACRHPVREVGILGGGGPCFNPKRGRGPWHPGASRTILPAGARGGPPAGRSRIDPAPSLHPLETLPETLPRPGAALARTGPGAPGD